MINAVRHGIYCMFVPVCVQLVLEPVDCRMTQLVFSSVARCVSSTDKLEVMAGELTESICIMYTVGQ